MVTDACETKSKRKRICVTYRQKNTGDLKVLKRAFFIEHSTSTHHHNHLYDLNCLNRQLNGYKTRSFMKA